MLVVGVLADRYVSVERLVGTLAELVHAYPSDPERSFWGVIESATVVGQQQTAADSRWEYRLRVVSQIALLARSVDCSIFQNLDVKDIVSQVLEQQGIASDQVDWRLTGTYPKHEYRVQYRESALAFVSRLLEEEGIYFFAEGVPDEGEKLVFADNSTQAADIEGGSELPKRSRSGIGNDSDAILTVADRRRVRSGRFVLRDYDFKRPKLDLTVEAQADDATELEVYDYPGRYTDPDEGKRLAQIRLEAEQVEGLTVGITADCTRVTVGRKIKVADADDFDGEYLVTAVHREYEFTSRGDAGNAERYFVGAELIPLKVKFRTPQITPKPVVDGPQTAVVVAPQDSPDQTIHTDEDGRCKLKFRWDRSEGADDKSSAWFRVAQLQTSGSMVLPRVGWEVIVEFLEGDPDRPLLTGRLYNGLFMPPYKLPEGRTRTALQTLSTPGGGGSNEVRFEDKAGSEEISIHSQYDTIVKAANNKTKNVGNNDVQTVTNKQGLEVSGNQDTKITKGNQNDIAADQSVTISGNRTQKIDAVYGLNVGGSATSTVGGNQFQMIGNPLEGVLAVAAERGTEALLKHGNNLVDQIHDMVQGAVSQVMGPVDAITSAANEIGTGMKAVADGNLGGAAALVAGASGIPGASQAMALLGATPPEPASTDPAPGEQASAAVDSGTNELRAAATSAIHRGMNAARNAVGSALGVGGGGGGGSSADNVAGPDGAASGSDKSKTTKGPGHHIGKIAGSHSETSAALRIMAVLNGINTNVTVTQTQNIGAAYVEMVLGDHAESTEALKSETQVGYVVVTKGDETEKTDVKTCMVGGAVLNLIKGGHSVEAGAPATFIGAFHKMQAGSSVTFKCGAAEVVVDGGGVTIEAPLVMLMTPKIQHTQQVNDG